MLYQLSYTPASPCPFEPDISGNDQHVFEPLVTRAGSFSSGTPREQGRARLQP